MVSNRFAKLQKNPCVQSHNVSLSVQAAAEAGPDYGQLYEMNSLTAGVTMFLHTLVFSGYFIYTQSQGDIRNVTASTYLILCRDLDPPAFIQVYFLISRRLIPLYLI